MKLLVSADHHFDEHRRFGECVRIHDFMVQTAREHAVDAFVSCGDIYERASTPRERDAVSAWLVSMASVCPVFIAKGNHDRPLDCALMGKLRSKNPIVVVEDCEVIHFQEHPVSLALVAWPERAGVLLQTELQTGMSSTLAEDLVTADLMQSFFRGLGQQLADSPDGGERVRIVAGHFMLNGAAPSSGQPLLGQPLRVTADDFDHLYADAVVMGHIHMPQESTTPNGTRLMYCGSPYRTNFGETEDKSILLIDTAESDIKNQRLYGSAYRVTRIPTPCAHMHLVCDAWEQVSQTGPGPDEWDFLGGPEAHIALSDVPGSDIRFRYTVALDQRDAAALGASQWERMWLDHGAHSVKVEEEVQSHGAARAPEIAAALTIEDKLLALWKLRDTTPTPDRIARLFSKVHELETS